MARKQHLFVTDIQHSKDAQTQMCTCGLPERNQVHPQTSKENIDLLIDKKLTDIRSILSDIDALQAQREAQ